MTQVIIGGGNNGVRDVIVWTENGVRCSPGLLDSIIRRALRDDPGTYELKSPRGILWQVREVK